MKAADLANKYVTIEGVTLPQDDGVLTVKAAVKSDVAGNEVAAPTEVSDKVTVDLTASTTIAINDSTDGEGYVNKAEFDGKTTTISGTVSDVEEGQTVTVTLTGKGGTTKTVEAKVGSDGKWETTATDFNGLSEGTITAVAKVVDKAGNEAVSAEDSTILDTVVPAPTIVINDKSESPVIRFTINQTADTDNSKITYIDSKTNMEVAINITKVNGKFEVSGQPEGSVFNKDTGTLVLPDNIVKGSTQIKVESTDLAGNKGTDQHDVPSAPVFDKDVIEVKYFENTHTGENLNSEGSIHATDSDGDRMQYGFYVQGGLSPTSEDGKYFMDVNTGLIGLTGAGGAIATNGFASDTDSNDFETHPNTFTYEIIAMDENGYKSKPATLNLIVSNVAAFDYLYNPLNDVNGAWAIGGDHGGSTDINHNKAQFVDRNGNNKVLIGYDEASNSRTGLGWGNIERGAVVTTYDGDDTLILSQSIGSNNQNGGADLGNGNNTVLIHNDTIGGASGGKFGRSFLITGSGNDVINVGDGDSGIDSDDIQNSIIKTGDGNDILTLNGGFIRDNTVIDLGAGDDDLIVVQHNSTFTTNKIANSVIILGAGNDDLDAASEISESTIVGGIADREVIGTVDGIDKIRLDGAENVRDDGTDNGNDTIKAGLIYFSNIDLGNGNNTINTNEVNGSNIYTGSGDDNITINGKTHHASNIIMGDGTNTLNIGGEARDTTINAGDGNNNISIGKDANTVNTNVSIALGDGDDNVIIKGSVVDADAKAVIDLGGGTNTLNVGDISTGMTIQGIGNNNITSYKSLGGGSKIILGTGDDNVIINQNVESNSLIDLGNGTNTLDIFNLDNSTIKGGSGNDSVTIGGALSSVKIDLGDGDNYLKYTGNTNNIDTWEASYIRAGSGKNDVLDLTEATGRSYISYNKSSQLIKGFETIQLGNNFNEENGFFSGRGGLEIDRYYLPFDEVDVLKIQGTSSSKVVLKGGGWSIGTIEEVNNHSYVQYINDGYKVLIEDHITNIIM